MPEFDKQPTDKQEYLSNEKWPILSRLRGPLGDQVLPHLIDKANYYQENKSGLFRTIKTANGVEVLHDPPTEIVCGIPTSGKSSVIKALQQLYIDMGYLLAPIITYEETLAEEHPDLEKPIDFNTFQRTEMRLYQKIISPMVTSDESQIYVRLVEMPVFGRFTPKEKKDPNYKSNRPRGSFCVHLLSRRRFFKTHPIHLLALTGNLQTQEEAIEHRYTILNHPEEGLNQYLWDQNLLDPKLVIDPQKVHELVKHMAMPKHWVKIMEEFGIREDDFKRTIKERDLDFVIDIALRIYEQKLGRRVTDQETITLIRMLTFDFFLESLGVPEDRILDAYNGYNPDLKQTFFNSVATK